MMQVAILWYWRQWKKHAHFWRHIWVEPTIFTRTAWENRSSIEELSPEKYAIVVCAIAPLDQQTKILNQILDTGYSWYLIIEKPITFSKELLEALVLRERTIFFIDEAYLCIENHILSQADTINISCPYPDQINVLEHVVAPFLRYDDCWSILDSISILYTESEDIYFDFSSSGNKTIFYQNWRWYIPQSQIEYDFDTAYSHLLRSIQDTILLQKIRDNYLLLRKSKHYIDICK